jgi:hypothetical protein
LINVYLKFLDDIEIDLNRMDSGVRVENSSFAWEEGKTILEDINLDFSGMFQIT